VAAVDTPRSAIKLLGGIQQKFPRLLRDKRAYTEPVKSGKTSLYRARFIGFESKSSARNACVLLKKQGVRCMAVHKG
jgi:D-alanyl-D-alanine carboxypeptidase